MNDIELGYKMVCSEPEDHPRGQLWSCCEGAIGGWDVRYEPEKWAWPKLQGSLLFAFRGLQEANRFYCYISGPDMSVWQLWRCLLWQPRPLDRMTRGCRVEYFWTSVDLLAVPDVAVSTPTGTYGCRAVKLLRRIK